MSRKYAVVLAALFVTIILVLSFAGCGGSSDNTNTTSNNSGATNKGNTSSTSSTSSTASADKVGVPECDDFIAKYDACVSGKVPESSRAQFKSSLDQWRTSWKKLADNPTTRSGLVDACKQARDQAATSMKSFGCTF